MMSGFTECGSTISCLAQGLSEHVQFSYGNSCSVKMAYLVGTSPFTNTPLTNWTASINLPVFLEAALLISDLSILIALLCGIRHG